MARPRHGWPSWNEFLIDLLLIMSTHKKPVSFERVPVFLFVSCLGLMRAFHISWFAVYSVRKCLSERNKPGCFGATGGTLLRWGLTFTFVTAYGALPLLWFGHFILLSLLRLRFLLEVRVVFLEPLCEFLSESEAFFLVFRGGLVDDLET